jgi:hypothetical protein
MARLFAVRRFPSRLQAANDSWDWLKPAALLFDTFALIHPMESSDPPSSRYYAEMEWLVEHDLIRWTCTGEAPGLVDPEDHKFIKIGSLTLIASQTDALLGPGASTLETNELFKHVWARATAAAITRAGEEATVLCTDQIGLSLPSEQPFGDVLSVAFRYMPQPLESTPWEAIVEFRNDPDNRALLIAFRRWLRQFVRKPVVPAEVSEEIEYLMHEYERHMRVQGMKVNTGFWETVITTGAKLAEDILKVKWADAAHAVFSLKHRRIQLLEAESNAPGREVAYILKAQSGLG